MNSSAMRESGVGAVILALAVLVPALGGDPYWAYALTIVAIYSIASASTNVLRAESGQYTFGQGAIFGAAAYSTALATATYGWNPVLAVLLGIAIAGVLGLLLALPALRVQGYYLGFVSLAAAVVFPQLLYGFSTFTHAVSGVPLTVVRPVDAHSGAFQPFSLIVLALAILALFGHAVLRGSRLGRRMRAAAISPEAAQTLRIRPGRVRVAAFVIAAVGAGVAGALYAPYFSFVSPDAFPVSFSVLLYFTVVVGGDSTIIGPLFGLFVLYVVPNLLLTKFSDYRDLIYGVLAFVIMALLPDGLLPPLKRLAARIWKPAPKPPVDIPAMIGRLEGERKPGKGLELAVSGVTKRFGAVVALDGVGFEAVAGKVHALIGPNGCGKSTTLNVISGLVRADAGEISLDGVSENHRPAVDIATAGVARGFQTPRVFDSLDAWDNIELGIREGSDRDYAWIRDALRGVPVSSFTHSERRWLELLRICVSAPRLVLLDEPAAGLSLNERQQLVSLIRSLVAVSGATVVLVEHDLPLVWGIADTVTVMSEGRVLTTGVAAEVRESESMDVIVGSGRAAR
ncbi:branched-chain amino acid ABC transporter ATP-binding protein/permease [Amycolatopsis sp. DSM 110486]|uniref:branched-chain amino acid ABC transporter ATP-binding protein/permease n=1 Tax=Amycolatopsis sp. DSM 110486 TaxID=2865832 RepID=UPI001C695B3E|nr:ATP-binding cassette domain-containing protein [Amycolatopsis sp. DSM 110486]QYN18110.1 ATP-binding cassette domain-containing protein [Amycolatopsis sp. DSM 110486]